MRNSKKGFWVILSVLLLFGLLSNLQSIVGIDYDETFSQGDYFEYKVNYSNDYDDTLDYRGKIGITISTIGLEYIYLYCENQRDGNTFYRIVEPSRSIGNLPLGSDNPLAEIPEIIDVIAQIMIVPLDWNVNLQLFIDSSYEYDQDVDIEYTAESDFVFHNLYLIKGLFRETCVLYHNFVADKPAEDFTVEGEKVNGKSKTVYSYESGFLLEHEVELVGEDTNNRLNLKVSLAKANIRIKSFSKWNYLTLSGISIFAPYVIGALYAGSVFLTKGAFKGLQNRKQQKEALEIQQKNEEELKEKEQEILKIQDKLPNDYDFVEQCPFCLEDVPITKKECPKCGGKR